MNVFIEAGQRRRHAKAATRARILDAARSELERLGFEATSIRAVAKEAGVATGTVLLHFPEKRDLLHAAVFEDLEATWGKARAASEASERALRNKLCDLVAAFFAYYAKRPALSRTLLRESMFAEPPWQARFAAQVADVHRHVAALTVQAQARGEVDRALDPELFGASFFAFYYFALMAWLQGNHPQPERLFARMLDQHLASATTTPKRKKGTVR